jgi:hypothetical protein
MEVEKAGISRKEEMRLNRPRNRPVGFMPD